ncbi:MAG: DUF2064 domain-containing protein [Proteobacteria bacterium]|nr:DUF2064 domain-containing protein [Pseudomonadota bacterium]
MTGGLAIFVKTPSLSPIKTRLASGVGQLRAEAFYLSSAEAVASVAMDAQAQGGAVAYWAVAESTATRGDAWLDLPRIAQGRGTLGERMDRVYRLLLSRHRFTLLVGADTPQLTSGSLLQAARWLSTSEPRLALGRAADGGFWLFGGNTPIPGSAWCRPTYSSAHTADEFVAAMSPFGRWLELERLTDVDHAHDLPTVQAALACLAQPTSAQQRLAQWLEDSSILAGMRA